MPNDYTNEKSRLREFLERRVIHLSVNKPPILKCPNPGHGRDGHDEHDSAVLYDNQKTPMVHCPVCGESWNIFAVAGLLDNIPNTKEEFPKLLKSVRDTLGMPMDEKQKPKETKKSKSNPVALSKDKAKEIYTKERVLELFQMSKSTKLNKDKITIAGSWPYHNEQGDIIGMDIRFEDGENRKEILTYWYDGKSLKYANAPVMIYNLQEVIKNETKPVLIVEGAKCVEAAKVLEEFIPISWSGGSGKAHLADFGIIKDREVFIFPDDDGGGIKAAAIIRGRINQAKIIRPILRAKEIKNHGADIVEGLQVLTAPEIVQYILNPDNHLKDSDKAPVSTPDALQQGGKEGLPPPLDTGASSLPFKIMGIGDDGKANFITEAGRLFQTSLESISKNKLLVLTRRWFWMDNYKSDEGKISWDWAADEMIRFSQNKDFDETQIRGRGAWRDGDRISYHDGVETFGEYDKKKIYLRLPKKDIGVNDKPIDAETTKAARNIVFKLSFETPADAVRCLGWSVLAPFAGGLKFRPAMLLTGPSGSGKSTVATLIIKRLADCFWLNGSESTVAGVRGKVQRDSVSIVFEETERDTEKKRINRDELFSLMRVNVTDDAPDTVKGTKEGGYHSFKMQNMFGFIAINPTIESIADENRIFRINMIAPKNQSDWKELEKQLNKLLSEENCRRIRALTWNKLKVIFALADKIVEVIRAKTGRDYRSSYADALLVAAFITIWTGEENPSEQQIEEMLSKYYAFSTPEDHRDESDEMIHQIMNYVVEVQIDNQRQKLTVVECLYKIYEMRDDPKSFSDPYRLQLSRIGVKLTKENNVAIINDSAQIKYIVKQDTGYSKILKRNKGFIKNDVPEYFSHDKRTHKCTVIKGILKFEDEQQKLEVEEGEIPF